MSDAVTRSPRHLPGWLIVFIDLILLLLCFFVLLHANSTLDATGFKRLAESMSQAFGVPRSIPVKPAPAPPAAPAASRVEAPRQIANEQQDRQEKKVEPKAEVKPPDPLLKEMAALQRSKEKLFREVEKDAGELRVLVRKEIEQGLLTVETKEGNIVVRVLETSSFPSGQAELKPDFFEVLDRISAGIASMPGRVIVAGHTDNAPIAGSRFRYHWELSAARAVTVAHELLRNGDVSPERVVVEGHVDSAVSPGADTPELRASQRRMEIVVQRGDDLFEAERKLIHAKLKSEIGLQGVPNPQER